MGQWEIRRSSLRDRDALAELCNAAAGSDDYVLEMLDDLILHGVFCVALDGDRIVGAMHYTETIDGSAWLRGARTHPAYRKRHVATELIESLGELARRSNRHALRLWASASNTAGIAAATACEFREVARFTRMVAKASRPRSRPEPLPYSPDLAAEVQDSRVLRLTNGYVSYNSSFVDLTQANTHLMANARALYEVGQGTVCLSTPAGDTLDFGLVAGDPARMLAALPGTTAAFDAEAGAGFLPHDQRVIRAAEKAGFRPGSWGEDAILFEKPIPVGPSSYRRRPTYAEIAAGKREGYAALALLAGHREHGHTGPHEDRWNP